MCAILFMIHCKENTGYAIASLEKTFLQAAITAGYSPSNIHFSYKALSNQPSISLPVDFDNKLQYDYTSNTTNQAYDLVNYIKQHRIQTVFIFDLNLENKLSKIIKKAGVNKLITYWGAPMSSINTGIKLLLKKSEVALRRYKPDLYIFESQAMVDSATKGRGIHPSQVKLVRLGVNIEKYCPANNDPLYLYQELGIPPQRKVVFYSGHMEPRKGVAVIVKAALQLVEHQGRSDLHFLICGNKGQEAQCYLDMLKDTRTNEFLTFAGYRNDLPILMASSYLGTIASTYWDSFTMSSIEMAASGLPLLVSDLQGLSETVEDGATGLIFPPGNYEKLADLIEYLADNEEKRNSLSTAARLRAERCFSSKTQVNNLAKIISS